MKKNINQDAFYTRLQELGQVNKTAKKSTNNNLGTLIDYRKSADGISYGIVQENHHYYVKKGGLRENPSVADFTYIGGVENITEYQFKSLAEADKQRNFMLKLINESKFHKVNENKTKINQNEDAVDDKIAHVEKKLPDLKATIAKEKEVPLAPEVDDIPDFSGIDGEGGGEIPPMGDEPTGDLPTDEFNLDEPAGEGDAVGGDENWDEIQKLIGKTTELIRDSKLEAPQTKSVINSILQALKKDLPEIEVEDRKEMANKILKIEDNAETDLEKSMPDEEPAEPVVAEDNDVNTIDADLQKIKKANPKFDIKRFMHKYFDGEETDDTFDLENDFIDEENEDCNECGTFAKYSEARGYDKKSLLEASNNERASIISGYINAFNEGKNNGDPKMVSVFINKVIAESLINDYGHKSYMTETLKPILKSLNETSRDDLKKMINEEFNAVKQNDDSKEAANNVIKHVENIKKAKCDDNEKRQMLIDMLGNSVNEEEIDEFFNLGNAAKAVGKVFGNKMSNAADVVGTGIGNAANKVGTAVGNAASAVGTGVSKAANAVGSGVKTAAQGVATGVQNVGKEIGQEYNKSQQTSVAGGVAKIAQELKAKIDQLNAYTIKNGGEPLKYGAILTSIANQLRSKSGVVNTDKFAANEGFNDAGLDVQPNLDEVINNGEEDVAVEPEMAVEPASEMTPAFDTIGVGGLGHGTTSAIDVSVDAQNKTVNISMNEREEKIRKYVHVKLQELRGEKKPKLNEDAKSEKAKKLDKLIESEFKKSLKKS